MWFSKFNTIKSFGRWIYSSIITLNYVFEEQLHLKDKIDKFKESAKQKKADKKYEKPSIFGNVKRLLKGIQKAINSF